MFVLPISTLAANRKDVCHQHRARSTCISAKTVAQSASRALGLLIAKYKTMGGLPYDVYTKLYDAVGWPVISHGASIWSVKTFSCINAVHNQHMRFFLGVGKFTPNNDVTWEMAWIPPDIRQWKSVVSHWARLSNNINMPTTRNNKRIAMPLDRIRHGILLSRINC